MMFSTESTNDHFQEIDSWSHIFGQSSQEIQNSAMGQEGLSNVFDLNPREQDFFASEPHSPSSMDYLSEPSFSDSYPSFPAIGHPGDFNLEEDALGLNCNQAGPASLEDTSPRSEEEESHNQGSSNLAIAGFSENQQVQPEANETRATKKEGRELSNFLPSARTCHIEFLQNKDPTLFKKLIESNPKFNKFVKKHPSRHDFAYVYKMKELRMLWDQFFEERFLYREMCLSRNQNISLRQIYMKNLYIFERSYTSGRFEKVKLTPSVSQSNCCQETLL